MTIQRQLDMHPTHLNLQSWKSSRLVVGRKPQKCNPTVPEPIASLQWHIKEGKKIYYWKSGEK